MKLGILAYASDTGLGNQTRDYVKHLNPTKVMAVDISRFNGMSIHEDWYPGAMWVRGIPTNDDCERFLQGLDCVLVAETPLNYHLFEAAKRMGVKIVQAYNYEFLDYFRHPEWSKPSILAAPSDWNTDIVRNLNIAPVIRLNVPVDTEMIQRTTAVECETFIHIIGRPAANDRNGTIEFLQAAMKLGNKYKYKIYMQPPTDARAIAYHKPVEELINIAKNSINLQVIINTPNSADMYKGGEVLVMPRKYGGLCLPMQEALAAGLPVIMTNVSPNDSRLPKDWLCDTIPDGEFFAHTTIPMFKADVNSLVECMDKMGQGNFEHLSTTAYLAGMFNSWDEQKQNYINLFTALCV